MGFRKKECIFVISKGVCHEIVTLQYKKVWKILNIKTNQPATYYR